jgi:uncharacterized protein (DUF488 family)
LEIATIGFTQTSAERFFGQLEDAGVKRVLDVRLHNESQLAGFAKGQDLAYFVPRILGAVYEHDRRLAPTEDMLAAYRARQIPWPEYSRAFLALMRSRDVPAVLDRTAFDAKTALLCSEPGAERCHRGLLAEMLAEEWGARIEHL